MKTIPSKKISTEKKNSSKRQPAPKNHAISSDEPTSVCACCLNGCGTEASSDSILTLANSAGSTGGAAADASRTTSRRTGPKNINRGITKVIHPVDLHRQIATAVLMHIGRFRVVRAVDVAVACFAERPYSAARQAARRALLGLQNEGFVRKYLTEKHQTIYAMTDAGSRHLERQGISSKSSSRRAASMVNPVHTLWLNMLVSACEARGLPAYTESELQSSLNEGVSNFKNKVRGILSVSANAGPGRTLLQPDLLATEEDGVTWFEVDTSRRGPTRSARFDSLAKSVGKPLRVLAEKLYMHPNNVTLRRVALLTDDILHLTRLRNKMLRLADTTKNIVLTTGSNNVRFVHSDEDIFEIWRAVESDNGQADVCVGHVILQMLPTGLPNYQGNNLSKSNPTGWFADNYLPYRRPQSMPAWVPPVSEFIRSAPATEAVRD